MTWRHDVSQWLLSSLATRNNTPPRWGWQGGSTAYHIAPGNPSRKWRSWELPALTSRLIAPLLPSPPRPSLIADIKLEHWFYLMLDGPFTLSRVLVQFYSCYSVTRSREQNKINPGTLKLLEIEQITILSTSVGSILLMLAVPNLYFLPYSFINNNLKKYPENVTMNLWYIGFIKYYKYA